MKTLYIDVYFLINFTVDILALYFAAVFSKVPTNAVRVVLSAVFGALSACLITLCVKTAILKLAVAVLSLFLMGILGTKRVRLVRKMKFTVAFIIFSALVGAGVFFIWGILDTYVYGYVNSVVGTGVNRKILIFALIVLLSIGIFRILISLFSANEAEGSVEIEIKIGSKSVRAQAFIDSGNLAVDPMDMKPVLLIKRKIAEAIIPKSVIELCDPDLIDREMRCRIRLIPIARGDKTCVLVGVRADSVAVICGERTEPIRVNIAIDKEGGSYGGYDMLIPSAALGNVR